MERRYTVLSEKGVRDIGSLKRNPEIYDDHSLKPIPLSPKQIKTMKSLTEGFAKLRLSSEAIKEDAENTLRIMKSLLRQYGYDAEENKIKVVSRNENE